MRGLGQSYYFCENVSADVTESQLYFGAWQNPAGTLAPRNPH